MNGQRISISPLLVLLLAAFFVIDHTVFAPLLVVAAILHETGHITALRSCGIPVESVTLQPFGVRLTVRGTEYLPYHDEFAVAASGPLANLLAAAITAVIVAVAGDFPGALFFIVANLALALINLMPVPETDGGRMLAAVLLPRLGLERGECVLRFVGAAASFLVLAAGLWLLHATRYNFSLALVGCYLLGRRLLTERDAL